MYKLHISSRAQNEVQKISMAHQEALIIALHTLQEDPYLGKPLTRNLTGRFSFLVGVYRIIYQIKEKDLIVLILSAGHRSTVYS